MNLTEVDQTLDLALDYHQAGRLAEAERLYRSVLASDPNNPFALHYFGLLANQVGKSDVAVDMIGKAIALMPDYVDAHCNLANVYVQMGQGDLAEACCRKALAFEPDRVSAHNLLGKALRLQGRLDEALDSSRKALALDPELADAYEVIGVTLSDLGRFQEAVVNLQKSLALRPNAAGCYNNIGNALTGLLRLNEAVQSYQKAIALEPGSALFYNNLGSVYHIQMRFDLAEKNIRKAIEINANDTMAYQNLANVLRDVGRVDEAIACFQKALDIDPGLTIARHNLNALQGQTTENAPREYVENLFDQFASRFEEHLVDKLEYNIPSLLKKTLVDLGQATHAYERVVDLGCGTGLVGVEFKDVAKNLIGIDLSKNMVREAEAKGVYDQLLVDDLISGLGRIDGKVDLFVCADVFIYVGSLHETFAAIKAAADQNALFLFSTEHLDGNDDFVLLNTSRYAHSKAYIEALANTYGFELVHFKETKCRKEKSGWIAGAIYVLRA